MSQQLLQRTEQDQQTDGTTDEIAQEQKEETGLSATVDTVTDDGVTVDLTKTVMRAEARIVHENGEERKELNFDEEEEQQTHTIQSLDSLYEQFKQSPWTLLQDALADTTVDVTAETQSLSPWSFITQLTRPQIDVTPELANITLPQAGTADTSTIRSAAIDGSVTYTPFMMQHQEHSYTLQVSPDEPAYTPDTVVTDRGTQDLAGMSDTDMLAGEQLVPANVPTEPGDYTELDDRTDVILPDIDALHTDAVAAQQTDAGIQYTVDTVDELADDADSTVPSLITAEYDPDETEYGLKTQISYTVSPEMSGNAAESIEQMFEQTELDGTVKKMTYQDTEDNYTTKESYWAEIDGMDMMQTEFFINGELADDSLDAYELAPGDTVTFVEADLFDNNSSEPYTEDDDPDTSGAGGACGGDLYLDDVLDEYAITADDVATMDGQTPELTADTAWAPGTVDYRPRPVDTGYMQTA
jgi:hypothetical protein